MRYDVQPGQAVPLSAPQETLDFLMHAKSRKVEVAGGGFVVSPNRTGDQVLLGASLRMNPGEYTVNLSATDELGNQRQTTLTVVVHPRASVPSTATRPPVVLLNGWEEGFTGGCPVATSSSEIFGNLADYLVTDGVPIVYLFDNCLEDPNQTIEQLGNDLGTFLNTIKYDNGTQVPQIDLVGFSMGGLIARSYLAGLQPGTETLTPPTPTLVRDLILIATPNFGSFVAGNYASEVVAESQSSELEPGSGFLWNLATWNQRNDDLRGVNALAVIGNAGSYTPALSSSTVLANASDGLVSLASASGGFVVPLSSVSTRIIPYCHVDPSTFTNTGYGTYLCNAAGIANVTSATQEAGLIVRSFLAGTTDWESIGNAPSADPYLSLDGAFFFALANSADGYVNDLTSVTFAGVALTQGGDTGTIFYLDFVHGTGALSAQSTSIGTVNCMGYPVMLAYTSAVRCKIGTSVSKGPGIASVSPLTGATGWTVSAGSAITLNGDGVTGSGFGTQCTGCKVLATAAGSSTSQQLTVTSWTNTAITVNLPASLTGLVTLQVFAVLGSDSINIMATSESTLAVSPSSLQFASTAGGSAPPAQSIQITNSGSGTLAWSATVSSTATWLSVSPASGTAPSSLLVSVSPASLSAGTYSGTIQITGTGVSNSPVSIGVTLTVTAAPPALAVTPQALTFQYASGGAIAGRANCRDCQLGRRLAGVDRIDAERRVLAGHIRGIRERSGDAHGFSESGQSRGWYIHGQRSDCSGRGDRQSGGGFGHAGGHRHPTCTGDYRRGQWGELPTALCGSNVDHHLWVEPVADYLHLAS